MSRGDGCRSGEKTHVTYIHRAINQTRQGSPRIEHYLAHVETPVSDFVRLVRSLARFVFVTPSWHVLTPSRSHSSAQWPSVVLVAHFPSLPFPSLPHLLSLSLPFSLCLSSSNSPCYPFLSPLQTHARLVSSSFLALLGFTNPRRPSRSRSSDAHGAYNFHIVPSRSQPTAGERAAGSLAPVAARMKESGALWSPVGSQLHESHRAARTAQRGRGTENIIAPSRARRSIKIENYDHRRAGHAVEKVRGLEIGD